MQSSLVLWTVVGGVIGGALHYRAVDHWALERGSAAARLLGVALSTGGAYASAWAWRVRARRQGVSAAAIESVQRAQRKESW